MRTVEEIRKHCRTLQPENKFSIDYKDGFVDALNLLKYYIDFPDDDLSAPVEPVKVDDVCEWRLNGVDMYENCTPRYVSKFFDFKNDLCPDCGRKILRKGE